MVNRPVFTRPWVNGAKPQGVQIPNVLDGKPVVSVKPIQSQVLSNFQRL